MNHMNGGPMGADRVFEGRMLSEDNFWPARAILVRVVARLTRDEVALDPDGRKLLEDARALVARTERT